MTQDEKTTAPEIPRARTNQPTKYLWRHPTKGHVIAALLLSGELVVYDVTYAAYHPDEVDEWVKTAAGAAAGPVPDFED